jgi:hypothetical protein
MLAPLMLYPLMLPFFLDLEVDQRTIISHVHVILAAAWRRATIQVTG